MKAIIIGVLLILAGTSFWFLTIGNPFDELSLVLDARITDGFITGTYEDIEDKDGREYDWYHIVVYSYTLPDGRQFSKANERRKGRLSSNLVDLMEPYPIKVEYLPDDPSVSRIKGEGVQTLFEWTWRKVGLGLVFFIMVNLPGIAVLRIGIKEVKDSGIPQHVGKQ